MNRHSLILAAFLSILCISCNKQAENGAASNGGNAGTQIVAYNADNQADEQDTKTVLDEDMVTVLWSPADEISVFFNEDCVKFTSINTKPKARTIFASSMALIYGGTEDSAEPYLYATYPYIDTNRQEGDYLVLTVPNSQTAVEGSFARGSFPAIGRSKNTSIAFYNVCGGFRFTVCEEGIRKVVIKGNNNEAIAGVAKVGFNGSNRPEVSEVVTPETTITLLAPNEGTFQVGKWYYISMLPGTLSNGFSLDFYKGESFALKGSASFDGSKTVIRSVFGSKEDVDYGVEYQEIEPKNPSFGAYDNVVIIGVDGAGAWFSSSVSPRSYQIFSAGASSYDAQAALPTISGQNWATILHGVLPEFHHITNSIAETREYDPNSPYPSIFRVVREAMPSAKLNSCSHWNPINTGIIECNINVDKFTDSDEGVKNKCVELISGNNTPNLLFVQFDDVDLAGHTHGYGTSGHLAQLGIVDGYIGQIYDAIVAKGIADKTLFMVIADHGGTPQGTHGGDTSAERLVFMGVSGTTVAPSSYIVEGEGRDVCAIAAYGLGLEIPDSWTGHVPTGVFPGVTAGERKNPETPGGENRKHTTEPTPALSEIQSVLSGHNVLAYLPFDNNINNAWGDITTSSSGKLYFYNAYYGQGVALDDGYITLNGATFGTSSFSVSFWIKTEGVTGDPGIISNKNWATGINQGWMLTLRSGDIKFNVGNPDEQYALNSVADLPDDYNEGWMHVVLSVNRPARLVDIVYDFTDKWEFYIPDEVNNISYDALTLNIGQDGTGTYSDHLAAQIDEMIITQDALSDGDIANLRVYYTGK